MSPANTKKFGFKKYGIKFCISVLLIYIHDDEERLN